MYIYKCLPAVKLVSDAALPSKSLCKDGYNKNIFRDEIQVLYFFLAITIKLNKKI